MLTAQIIRHFRIVTDWANASYFETDTCGNCVMMWSQRSGSIVWFDLRPGRFGQNDDDEPGKRLLQQMVRKAHKPVVLFIDEAHDIDGHTLNGLKPLMEFIPAAGEKLSAVLVGHPHQQNDLRHATMEEIGNCTSKFDFVALGSQHRAFLQWFLETYLEDGVDSVRGRSRPAHRLQEKGGMSVIMGILIVNTPNEDPALAFSCSFWVVSGLMDSPGRGHTQNDANGGPSPVGGEILRQALAQGSGAV